MFSNHFGIDLLSILLAYPQSKGTYVRIYMFSPYSRFHSTVSNMKFTRVRINGFYNLRDVDLDLTNGNALIVGPNGSGKTNIIKCLNFLVKQILDETADTNMRIWDVNVPKCYIKVNATLSKAEVEMFSNLRVCYLVYNVCEVVAVTVTLLQQLVEAYLRKLNPHQSSIENCLQKIRNEMYFHGLPEETFNSIVEDVADSFTHMSEDHIFRLPSPFHEVELSNPCVASLIKKTTNKLFPRLLKVTKETLASKIPRPKNGSDVFMWVETGEAATGLDHSSNM